MKLPLRVTIVTTFTVLAFISVAVVAGVNFIGGRITIEQTAHTKIEDSIDSARDAVESLLRRSALTVEGIANLPAKAFNWQEPGPLLNMLTIALRNQPEVYGIFVGFPNGAFVQAINLQTPGKYRSETLGAPANAVLAWRTLGSMPESGERAAVWQFLDRRNDIIATTSSTLAATTGYDPRARPWYESALKSDTSVMTAPYVFESSKRSGITVSQAVQKYRGAVVGIDLSLNDLSRMAVRHRPGDHGLLLVLNARSRIIASSRRFSQAGEMPTADPVDDPLVQASLSATTSPGMALASFRSNGHEFIGLRTRADKYLAADWSIVVAASLDDFTGGLNSTIYRSLILSSIVLILSVIAVAVMTGLISRPVLRLREMADKITSLDTASIHLFDSPFAEIGQLQRSMERMRVALDVFLRFIPRDVVRDQLQSGEAAIVGGTRRQITLLFTDIENFTQITEDMTPEQIMAQVSSYFDQLSKAIQANNGVIDKYIGDAVMALWNAPADDEFHIRNACRAVLVARRRSVELNEVFAGQGLPKFHTRFGMHCCEALVGNIGAQDRMQYTCLGSGVNLASRIEGLNKFYGTQILASDTVRKGAPVNYLFRRIDLVRAKGISRPITIFELIGERDEESEFYVGPDTMRAAGHYEQAFDFYLHRDFSDALKILDKLHVEHPSDMVIETLIAKCRAFDENPPPASWDGSTVLVEK